MRLGSFGKFVCGIDVQPDQGWMGKRGDAAISVAIGSLLTGMVDPVYSQVIPDDTLGSERSRVRQETIRGVDSDRVEGGARRGGNLFHSFVQLDVGEERGVYFSNQAGVENIFGRVTGNLPSNVLGTLGVIQEGTTDVLGTANLFLMNPNGIVFGRGARLDLGGSFTATTADAIGFGGETFSALNPGVPSQVLVVNPSAFLFSQIPARNILSFAIAPSFPGSSALGLQVPNGETLTLLGGSVGIDGGGGAQQAGLHAFGGRVEIGSMQGVGAIGLNANSSLSFPESVERGDVFFVNRAIVDVSLTGGGDVNVNARNIGVLSNSLIKAGIDESGGNAATQAGDLSLNATELVGLEGGSRLQNDVSPNRVGNAGNLNITAGSLEVTDVSQLTASTFGQGNAGNVIISVRDRISLDRGAVFSRVGQNAVGNGGDIRISTNNLSLTNGAQLSASTGGQGDAGNIIINARDRISLDTGTVLSRVGQDAVGNAGDILISTNSLSVTNGAQLTASTLGEGDAGNVVINARDRISFSGSSADGQTLSTAFSTVEQDAVGQGGDVRISTNSLSLTNGARLTASTLGQGNAGNVIINARDRVSLDGGTALSAVGQNAVGQGGNVYISTNDLSVTNGAQLSTITLGQGDAGNVIINARDSISLNGASADGRLGSSVLSRVEQDAIGNAGNIDVSTGTLSLSNGAQLSASSKGQGNAGDVIINASDRVSLDGTSADGQVNSAVLSTVEPGAIGNGGDIRISTSNLSLTSSTRLSASTFGEGDAGSVIIEASDRISFDGGSASSTVGEGGVGQGGDIRVSTNDLFLINGGQLTASTFEQGDAGNVIVEARNRTLVDGTNTNGQSPSGAFSTVGQATAGQSIGQSASGQGGDVHIFTNDFTLTNSARLATNTFGQGDAGNITIEARDRISLDGGFASSTVEQGAIGNGGDISISTNELILTNGAQLSASTSGQGDAGNVIINAHDRISLEGSTAFSSVAQGAIGNGGDIRIFTDDLFLTDGAQLTASSKGQGDAGSIIINARNRISLHEASAALSSIEQGAIGNGGDVRISTNDLFLTNGAQVSSGSNGRGNAGDVIINARNHISLNGTSVDGQFNSAASSTVGEDAIGNGGDLLISTSVLSLINDARLSTSTAGQGDAGNIVIEARDRISSDGGTASSRVERGSTGNGGDVRISTNALSLTNGAQLTASTFGQGNAGDVIIDARDRVSLNGTSADGLVPSAALSTVESGAIGQGGDIRISTNSLALTNGAALSASTLGQGNAGSVIVEARDRISLSNSSALSAVEQGAIGQGGNIRISTNDLSLTNGARLAASTAGRGDAGNVLIEARDRISLNASTAFSTVEQGAIGQAGNIRISTNDLSLANGAGLTASTSGQGNAGNVIINARDRISLRGVGRDGRSSGIFTSTTSDAIGRAGNITLTTPSLHISNGAVVSAGTDNSRRGGSVSIQANNIEALRGGQILTATESSGRAGSITLNADRITLSDRDATFARRLRQSGRDVTANEGNGESGLFASTRSGTTGNGGRITVNASELFIDNGATISAQSLGSGTAGDITLNTRDRLNLNNSRIVTEATNTIGGDIRINTAESAENSLTLLENSDITTNSRSNGGNIDIQGNATIAFGDSDILARSSSATGGEISLGRFFSQTGEPFELRDNAQGNGQVDVNAQGRQASGNITTTDTSFIQNSLADIPEAPLDTDRLLANSCLNRTQQTGRFTVTGTDGLPQRPGNANQSAYPTGTIQSIPQPESMPYRPWRMGDAIVEPQGVARLPDGRLAMEQECSTPQS
jgi:filamentous hemagglutinin family protein